MFRKGIINAFYIILHTSNTTQHTRRDISTDDMSFVNLKWDRKQIINLSLGGMYIF